MKRSSLSPIAALGAVVLVFQAFPAAADNTFHLQNCTGATAPFTSYDKGDIAQLAPAQHSDVEDGQSMTFLCFTDHYCWAQAISNSAPVYRVANSITFYSMRRYVHFIDVHCAGK